ncbi:MAG: hypothetical protein RR490_03850 [Niameybacter sp.]
MKKKITKFLGLGLAFTLLISSTVFANDIKYLDVTTETDIENIEFNLSESIPCEPIPSDSDNEVIVPYSGELGDAILVSTGWQEYSWKATMPNIRIHAKNNGSQTVYCEITKSDGTYLGAGRNFTLKPGESNTFTRSAVAGEYKIYVFNDDGSRLNVFVSARQ